MPGDKMRIAREIDPCLDFQHAHDGKRHRHQRGLRVLRERQLLRRSFPDDFREVLIEGGVNLGKDLACRHESIGKRLAHADCLTSLTRKYECGGHPTYAFGNADDRISAERPERSHNTEGAIARATLLERPG